MAVKSQYLQSSSFEIPGVQWGVGKKGFIRIC